MSDKDLELGRTFAKVFSPSDYGFTKFEWVKKPTHFPQPRPTKLYSIEVVDMHGNPAPFFAYPKPFKDTLN